MPATVTNKQTHVATELADDVIRKKGRRDIYILEFDCQVSYGYENNDMSATCMDIVLKQIIKNLIVLINLKNINERRIHCLIHKADDVRIA